MKRIAVLSLGLLALGALLYAQTTDSPQPDNRRLWHHNRFFDAPGSVSGEKLSLTGTLGLSRGVIVLKNGEETWYTPGLRRYIGFIDGLKEGAAVALEGWGGKIPQAGENTGFLRVSKLTLNGKDYEVGPAEPGIAQGPGWNRSMPPMPREYHGTPRHRGRMGPMMRPGWGPRDLPELRRHFRFRSGPEES
ncbi:MAG: hypothetical protein LBH51_06595 [Treponema sp.]|jgi:hypothetical protein|nr:hypothetical protein [Treponema sp.]